MSKQKNIIFRIADANGNRASEGLRVVEDYFRFACEDSYLTARCKQLRHQLGQCLRDAIFQNPCGFRESNADVGRTITTDSEYERLDLLDVVAASFSRTQQALRSLEEYSKLLDPATSTQFEQIRYETYQLQLSFVSMTAGTKRLENCSSYILCDAAPSAETFARRMELLVTAGVDVVQLRDKDASSRALVDRCRLFRKLAKDSPTLLVVNDRPDIACIGQADGVHLGQDDMSVHHARAIVGPDMLIGVSTHDIGQVESAISDGANYIGVGPTFESKTKSFAHFTGLDLLRTVAERTKIPAFAIGGITHDNLQAVLDVGCTRVAVSGAIWLSNNPKAALEDLLNRLAPKNSIGEKVDG